MRQPTQYGCRRKIMNYEEFKSYKEVTDNNFVKKFESKEGHIFYIEPAFYTQLMGLKERYPENIAKILNQIDTIINKNKLVAFVYDYEAPFLDYGEAVLREFVDVTDAAKVFYEDKSRGSDYGD